MADGELKLLTAYCLKLKANSQQLTAKSHDSQDLHTSIEYRIFAPL
jgi:hypothetical protein